MTRDVDEDEDKRRPRDNNNIKTTSTMTILSNSWAQHLASAAGTNDANKNMRAFTAALTPHKFANEWREALIEEIDAAVLLVGPKNLVQQTHSWTKFGGTRSRPQISIACLISAGPRATVISLNHTIGIRMQTVHIPTTRRIAACKMVDNFIALSPR
jgi:hypothetical protein